MSATITEVKGVWPLVCAVCEEKVGVINAAAMLRILEVADIYICAACSATAPENIEETLGAQPSGYYTRLVFQSVREMRQAAA
jgi:hypothetical protein